MEQTFSMAWIYILISLKVKAIHCIYRLKGSALINVTEIHEVNDREHYFYWLCCEGGFVSKTS